mgnify:CR=1 FL=1
MTKKRFRDFFFSDCNRCESGLFESEAVELLRAVRSGKLSPALKRRLTDWEEWDALGTYEKRSALLDKL